MVSQSFYIFQQIVPRIVELETYHVCIKIIIINEVGVVRTANAEIVSDLDTPGES